MGSPRKSGGDSELSTLRSYRTRPWRIGLVSVLGLLLATALAGVAGLIITRNVARVTDQALGYNVELEDQADDFRIAVLDVRHFHRNLLFAGPSGQELADFDGAYASLIEEIDLLESLGIRDPHAPQPGEVRQMAEHYNRGF